MRRQRSCGGTSPAVVFGLLLLCAPVPAREFEVRLLSGTETDGVWGTVEFQLSVRSSGLVRELKIGERELIWQVAALYTHPVAPDGTEGVRTVQGEGYGERGLSLTPPAMRRRAEGGKRLFEFDHLVANKRVLDGAPLCRVLQTLTITPTGEVLVAYDFEWLETVRWHGFEMLLFLKSEPYRDQDFLVFAEGMVRSGKIEPGPPSERQVRSELFSQVSLQSVAGPVHFLWHEKSRCSFRWPGEELQLSMTPPCVPYRGFVYKGQKDRIAYRILLPVSQQ